MPSASANKLPPASKHLDHASTFSVWPGWQVLMQDIGLNRANVLRRAQLPPDLFAQDSVRLDVATYYRLWQAVEDEAGSADGPIPLRLAKKMSTDWFNPELFVALCSPDMNYALSRLAKYKRLSGPMALKLEQNHHCTTATVEFLDRTRSAPHVFMAFKLVFFLQLARLATRSAMHARRVGWPNPNLSARDARAYAAWFGVAVEDLPVPTIAFTAADAQLPFLTANHGMWEFFEPTLCQRLADLEQQATTVDRVRSVLLETLPTGDVSMAAICKKLGVSTRTLQRRLREEGSSFQQTLSAVRNTLAHHYLHNSSLSGSDISFLLGFEDPNSFVRAFQVWTGSTPQAVRLEHSKIG